MAEIEDQNTKIFLAIPLSFMKGMVRLHSARLAAGTLDVAYRHAIYEDFEAAISQKSQSQDRCAVILRQVTSEQITSLEYVRHISELVYATTLFDTFLTDITRFLFLLMPKSAGKNSLITLEALLSNSSKA